MREQDLVSRIGGDEFIIAISGKVSESSLLDIANKLNAALDKLANDFKPRVELSVSIGIACSNDGQLNTSELIRQADIAMYQTKQLGKHGARVYQEGIQKK